MNVNKKIDGSIYVRKWYEILKTGTTNGLVQRIFATGVSSVTLDGLTSGFNISKNKTRDIRFNECMGFTEEFVGMDNLLKMIFVFCNDKVVYEQRVD